MSRFYYHHVGQKGSVDLPKTVFQDVDVSVLEQTLPAQVWKAFKADVVRLFPKGRVNCWGVPVGARPVLDNLAPGDFVLLVEYATVTGAVPTLCPVQIIVPGPQYTLSEALWGDQRYPLIFLFDTIMLNLQWPEFLQHLEYLPNYNPRGHFLPVEDTRLMKFGGASGYAAFLQNHYGTSSR